MTAKQIGAWGLTVVIILGSMGRAAGATITLSLDAFYGDSNGDNLPDAAAAGSWQLVAHSSLNDNRGIAGVTTKLIGVVNSVGPAGSTFRAPTGEFDGVFEAGFQTQFGGKSFQTDTDANPATTEMLFSQIPVEAPGPQGLFYDVGQQKDPSIKASNDAANGQPAIPGLATVTWNFNDPLGDYLADADQTDNDGEFQRGVILAQGRFNAGSVPAFVPGQSLGNVFTQLGSQTNPPGVGTIQAATATITIVRNNLFTFAGDASLDHDVDVAEPGGGGDGQIVQANLGRSGNVLWQEGDFNGDKDCDVFQADGGGDAQILTAALGSGELPPVALALAAAGTATATYNSVTGELKADIGAGVGVVGFETAGLFNTSIYLPALLPSYFSQITPNVLGLFDGGNPLPEGVFLFGNVLPAGLGANQIQFGYTPIGSPSVLASVVVVPEPMAAMLGLVGAALLATCGRRRGR